ncbi:hypothetical protein B0T17DRAFT_240959 [Bombardia bombarda]|uniref:Uncharacterized protein n=1 Tax=Bombardia bombarda TaxID=252184 RepID=A0AA40CAH6_9PEZI|nr:hypothetical protein B0T17DRAFT_240959 [Bombardia bombarda]
MMTLSLQGASFRAAFGCLHSTFLTDQIPSQMILEGVGGHQSQSSNKVQVFLFLCVQDTQSTPAFGQPSKDLVFSSPEQRTHPRAYRMAPASTCTKSPQSSRLEQRGVKEKQGQGSQNVDESWNIPPAIAKQTNDRCCTRKADPRNSELPSSVGGRRPSPTLIVAAPNLDCVFFFFLLLALESETVGGRRRRLLCFALLCSSFDLNNARTFVEPKTDISHHHLYCLTPFSFYSLADFEASSQSSWGPAMIDSAVCAVLDWLGKFSDLLLYRAVHAQPPQGR